MGESVIIANGVLRTTLDQPSLALRFLEILGSLDEDLLPERYAETESNMLLTQGNDLSQFLDQWTSSFVWKRKKPRVDGSVFTHVKYRWPHALINMHIDDDRLLAIEWQKLLFEWATAFDVGVAFVHCLTPREVERGRRAGYVRSTGGRKPKYFGLVTSSTLNEGLPELWWATCFGASYVELIGRERLLASPCHAVNEHSGGVTVQLTEHLDDVATDADRFDETRCRVIEHIGRDIFRLDAEAPVNGVRAPNFTSRGPSPSDIA